MLSLLASNTILLTDTKQNIDNSIQTFTNSIQSALDNSSYFGNNNNCRPAIPAEMHQEINAKNHILRDWQQTRDPLIKKSLNAKINFIRLMLQTHRKDEWDKYLNSLNHNENLIYKLNRSLLRKRPATHSILGPNELYYSAEEKQKLLLTLLRGNFLPYRF